MVRDDHAPLPLAGGMNHRIVQWHAIRDIPGFLFPLFLTLTLAVLHWEEVGPGRWTISLRGAAKIPRLPHSFYPLGRFL